MSTQPEVWLRGPVERIDPLLQPAAHALLQTGEDVQRVLAELSAEQIWATPGGAASVGFHVLHLIGSIDRLFTYARGETLSDAQRAGLAGEKNPVRVDSASLIQDLRNGIDAALGQLRDTPHSILQERRTVGRAALPTTVLGLLFHAGEHSQRHAGQIVTTAKIVRLPSSSGG
jgi:DinB superfamily